MSNTIIVTPNGNVAMHLQRCEQSKEYHPREAFWIPRPVYTLDEWIGELAVPLLEEFYSDYMLLKPVQEKALWREIISSWNPRYDRFNVTDRQGVPLLGLANTIRQAALCWKSLRQYHALETPYIGGLKRLKLGSNLWQGSEHANIYSEFYLRQLNDLNFNDSTDSRNSSEFNNFNAWQREFQKRCQQNHWIDSAVLPSLVAAHLQDASYADRLRHAGKLPNKIVAYGFMEAPEALTPDTDVCSCTLTPQRTALLKAFLNCGCQVVMAADMNDTELYPGLEKLECKFTCQMTPKPQKKDKKKEEAEDPKQETLQEQAETQATGTANETIEYISVYNTTDNEFRAIAQEALKAVLPTTEGGLGLTNVGVIVPELETHREIVRQAFDEALCPQCLWPEHYADPRPYTVSLGQSLDQVPIVSEALKLLRSLSEEMPLTALTDTIFSPYLGDNAHDLTAGANFNANLRTRRQYGYTLSDLLKAPIYKSYKDKETQKYVSYKKVASDFIPEPLRQGLLAVQRYLEANAGQHDLAFWGTFFTETLDLVKWGATQSAITDTTTDERSTLGEDELRAKRRFLDLLESWAELATVSRQPLDLTEAVHFLTEQTKDTIFQVPAAYKAPIHISGILETVGLRFQRIFVMNYTDQSWPSLGTPQPYLPMELQRTLHMPVAEDKLRQANWVNDRLASLASSGVLSFANAEIAERLVCELNMSRLHDNLRWTRVEVPEDKAATLNANALSYCQKQLQGAFTEKVTASENKASASDAILAGDWINENLESHQNYDLPPAKPEELKGGSALLNNQLSCPFKAFVDSRWHVEELDESGEGINALDNGSFIHATLENLWGKWKGSTGLANLSADERREDIHTAVQTALKPLKEQYSHYGEANFQLAQTKACAMLEKWFDPTPDPDFRLEVSHALLGNPELENYAVACEQTAEHCLLPLGVSESEPHLDLTLRLDRLDEFTDKSVFVSDYKTGNSYNPTNWYAIKKGNEPPQDVQLPMYALHIAATKGADKLRGLGFDILKASATNDSLQSIALVQGSAGQCGVRSSRKIDGHNGTIKAYDAKQKDKNFPGYLNWSQTVDFPSLLEYWKQWVNTAAQELLEGKHTPTPSNSACKYCKYGLICCQAKTQNEEDNQQDNATESTEKG